MGGGGGGVEHPPFVRKPSGQRPARGAGQGKAQGGGGPPAGALPGSAADPGVGGGGSSVSVQSIENDSWTTLMDPRGWVRPTSPQNGTKPETCL